MLISTTLFHFRGIYLVRSYIKLKYIKLYYKHTEFDAYFKILAFCFYFLFVFILITYPRCWLFREEQQRFCFDILEFRMLM